MMFFDASTREQLLLSLLSWAVFIALYGITKWRGGSVGADFDDAHPDVPTGSPPVPTPPVPIG
jgi:hypothetical protein